MPPTRLCWVRGRVVTFQESPLSSRVKVGYGGGFLLFAGIPMTREAAPPDER